MKKNFSRLLCWVTLIILIDSCSKDKVLKPVVIDTNSPITLGLYEYGVVDTGKRIFIPISKIGTQNVSFYSVFDTGSSGMTIDAHGILPSSMISSSGLQFTGDSVVVNGITITSVTGTISYGNQTSLIKEYGNLAYATITIGDQNGNATAKRVPMFLYYRVFDVTNNKDVPVNHSLDIFGVGPGTSYVSSQISSPLSYFSIGSNLTKGFKLAALHPSSFTNTGAYVADLLTIGLTAPDLTTNGFTMHPLSNLGTGGYSPNIPSTITYNGQSIAADVLFDTGTPLISTIENKLATTSTGNLPAKTSVTITTNKGFTYTYITSSTGNLTAIENPNVTGDLRTIFGIDFFINNEYLTDYTNHQIGLKNN